MAITPENYIEKLRTLRKNTTAVNREMDTAIDHIQRRLETGYTFLEDDSKRALMWALENVKILKNVLEELSASKIDYES